MVRIRHPGDGRRSARTRASCSPERDGGPVTENRTTTDAADVLDPETTPSDDATTDALESVTTTEQPVTHAPAADLADDAAEEVAAGEAAPAGTALVDKAADSEEDAASR